MEDRLIGGLTPRDLESSTSGRLAFVQKAFVVADECLLLVQKSPSDPYYPGLWEVPGGRMKLREDADDHIRRETWEETGIDVSPGVPFHIWQWYMPDLECPDRSAWLQTIAVARICHPLTSKPSTRHQVTGDYLSQVRWVPIAEIPGFHLIPGVDDAFSRFLSLKKDEILQPLLAL